MTEEDQSVRRWSWAVVGFAFGVLAYAIASYLVEQKKAENELRVDVVTSPKP